MPKIEIEVWANDSAYVGEPYVSTDLHGRLRLSSGLVEKLSCRDMPIKLYIGYDKANRRIALGKWEIIKAPSANPVQFDRNRHYAYVKRYYDKFGIPVENARYYYDGDYQGWMLFKRKDYDAPDGRGQ
ncbi:hypothetical protein SCOTTIE_82 [Paenibacillus phage Scottie]|uniref:Uncharacterized protein n=1 Tax=Paenibacillus phage Scottie TaxID=1636259 RepID=A0A345AVL2_9CAUD|nr:hypothetical protein KMD19_gp82 [Paenibacillus phage Scottie]AXF40945.1 hypothetical protein SCOTTIE_82 [Paenibacillus phage Scottie]